MEEDEIPSEGINGGLSPVNKLQKKRLVQKPLEK